MLLVILFLLFSTCLAAAGVEVEGRFVDPPELSEDSPEPLSQPINQVGQIIEVQLQSNDPTTVLDLIIKQAGNPEQNKLPNSGTSGGLGVNGSDGGPIVDLLASNQFSFEFFQKTHMWRIATSGWFNISNTTVNQYGDYIGTKILLETPLPTAADVDASGTVSASATDSITSTFITTTSRNQSLLPTTSLAPTNSAIYVGKNINLSLNLELYVGVAVGNVVYGAGIITVFCI